MWPIADSPVSVSQALRIENILHQPQRLHHAQLGAITRADAGRFLAAMLQSVKPEIGKLRGFRIAKNADHTAMIVEVIVFQEGRCQRRSAFARLCSSGLKNSPDGFAPGVAQLVERGLDRRFAYSK